jgi:hypothetical protein
MPRKSAWGSFLLGRDPNPPIPIRVMLMGCRPFECGNREPGPKACPDARKNCRVCGGAIRAKDLGHYCLFCDRVDPASQAKLEAALKATDPATREGRVQEFAARDAEQAAQVDRMRAQERDRLRAKAAREQRASRITSIQV